MTCGIYKITSPSGKFYIGSSIDINRRWKQHVGLAARGIHHSPVLQAAFEKYGASNFKFEVVLECSPEELLIREQEAIDACRPKYNILPVAGSSRGHKMSEHTRRKVGAATKERAKSESYRKLLSEKGKEFMSKVENRTRISAANAARVWSDESRKKQAEIVRERNSIDGGSFAKLDWDKVRSIRVEFSKSDMSPCAKDRLAKRFNVTRKTINTVLRGDTWKE